MGEKIHDSSSGAAAQARLRDAPARIPGSGAEPRDIRVSLGHPLPLGVQDRGDGFNFAIFSRHAEKVSLLLFESALATDPLATVELDPLYHRTGDIWHVLIGGVYWGHAYAFRVAGPYAPEQGNRFDGTKLLLDPYALAVSRTLADQSAALMPRTRRPTEAGGRSILVKRSFDWQEVTRPRRPWPETVIYETHVRGLTIHPSAQVARPGTFLAIVEKIGYFVALGVTAIELMPVQEFDAWAGTARDPRAGLDLPNYWGYDTISFFAPNAGYGTGASPGSEVEEFKTMVRELHRAGIEVILDVVFNHTAENDETGPTFNFRGLDNAVYYILEPDTGRYLNFSGCGNTVNCNHPVVRDYIIDCLRYWVSEMQVDGFRFDLASILGRDEHGRLAANAPLLERIAEDPVLRDVKLIAEAWDMGGAYQVGSFPGLRWAEWNGRFRDDVRRFWRGDPGMTGAFATRLCGSADLYQRSGKQPVNSVNFITCHDGFTLNDLVTYASKHNDGNGAGNQDGASENFSANYGIEGPTDDPKITAVRLRQIKNMLATLFLSRGVPMLLGGDEFRRTQRGNNNAYCQDSEISWYDWRLLDRHHELHRFVQELIALRRKHPVLSADAFYSDADILWFGPFGREPDWNGATRALGCLLRPPSLAGGGKHGAGLCLLFNATMSSVEFTLPGPPCSAWRTAIDTGAIAPSDIFPMGEERELADQAIYRLGPLALAALVSR